MDRERESIKAVRETATNLSDIQPKSSLIRSHTTITETPKQNSQSYTNKIVNETALHESASQ